MLSLSRWGFGLRSVFTALVVAVMALFPYSQNGAAQTNPAIPVGTISGQVTDLQNHPLANIPVNLNTPDTGLGTCTDASGHYTFSAVPLDIVWHAHAIPFGEGNHCGGSNAYAEQYWNHKTSWDTADTITLTGTSPTRSGIDFALAPAGGISGHIYRANGGTPVANAGLLFFDGATGKYNNTGKWGKTGSDGSFTVWGFPAGPVYIRSSANDPTLIDEWYAPGASVIDGNLAAPVTIIASAVQTNIDFQLNPGGSISGQIRDLLANPLANIPINLDGPTSGQGACTDDSGNYTFGGVQLGVAWMLEAMKIGESNQCGGSNGYDGQFWDHKQDWGEADTITLTEASPTRNGIDFDLAPAGGISGHIYRADGTTPVANAMLLFFDGATGKYNNTGKWGETGSDGSFTIWGFPLGSVYVSTSANWSGKNPDLIDEWYAPGGSVIDGSLAEPVTITAGALQTDINFQLNPGGSISGQIRNLLGNPLAKIPINLDGPTSGQGACTDDSGNYAFGGVQLGVAWTLEAMKIGESNQCGGPNGYDGQFWDHKQDWGEADTITLTEASPTRNGIDFDLAPAGGISGHIYRADGTTPVANAMLLFFDGATGKYNNTGKWGETGSDGSFTIWGFPLGSVYVSSSANWSGKNPDLIDEWYAPGGSVIDGSLAEPVTITAGALQTDINFQLDTGGTISGQVNDALGNPLDNIPVNLHGPGFGSGACTDGEGRYTFSGVNFGMELRVEAMSLGDANRCGGSNAYAQQFWNQKQNWDEADTITLTEASPTRSDVDFALAPGGGLGGYIYLANGITPVADVGLVFFNKVEDKWIVIGKWGNTGSDGSFTIWGFPLGPVYVGTYSNDPALFDEWYAPGGSVIDGNLAMPVIITAGNLQIDINFQLDKVKKLYLPVIRR